MSRNDLAHPRVVLGLERQRAPFAVQDLLELLADLLQGTAEVERLLLLLAHLLEAAAERVHPGEPALHPAAHQAPEGVVGARAHQDVVGELLQTSDASIETSNGSWVPSQREYR